MSRLKYYRTYEEMKTLALPFFEAVANVLTGKRAEKIRQNIDQELLWEHTHDPIFGQDLGVDAWDLSVEFKSCTDTIRFIGSVHLGHGPTIVEDETPEGLVVKLQDWL